MKIKIQCDNCPAKNKRVQRVDFHGKRLYLCEACLQAVRALEEKK